MGVPFRYAIFLTGILLGSSAAAATVAVVGTPHLRNLDPAATPDQVDEAVGRLASFEPSLVCIEAMPGERVEEFLDDPERYGELLRRFALTAVQLAPEQQLRLKLDGRAARQMARELERQPDPLESEQRLRLIALQLAAYEPWSALLNWVALDDKGRDEARKALGSAPIERLEILSGSSNEIVALGIPLALRAGHRRLCAVDSFVDELSVHSLAEGLMPIIGDPELLAGIQAFAAEQAKHWRSDRPDGLVDLLRWMNSAEWAGRDRATQWDVFAEDAHGAPARRLMLWHARNAEILAWLFRNLAAVDGERTLLLIGGSHRPFLDEALEAHRWLELVPAGTLLAH